MPVTFGVEAAHGSYRPDMDPKIPIRGIDYTVIHARDMDAMRKFYGTTLGLTLLRELSASWVEYRVGANVLALAQSGGRYGDAPTPPQAASVQLAFRVTRDEVDTCADILCERGVAITERPTDQAFGHRTLFFRDPDGNLLEVFADI